MAWSPPTLWSGQSVPITSAEMQKISDDLNYLYSLVTGGSGGASPTLSSATLLGTTTMGNTTTDGLVGFQSIVGPKINLYGTQYGVAVDTGVLSLFSAGTVKLRASTWNAASLADGYMRYLHLDDGSGGIIFTDHGDLYLRSLVGNVRIDQGAASLIVGGNITGGETYSNGWFRNNNTNTGWVNQANGIGLKIVDAVAPQFYAGSWANEYIQSHGRHDNQNRTYTGAGVGPNGDPSYDLWVITSGTSHYLPALSTVYGRYIVVKNMTGVNLSMYFTDGNGIYTNAWLGQGALVLLNGDSITLNALAGVTGWVVI